MTARAANAPVRFMHRAIPKLVVMAAIAAVVLAIYYKTRTIAQPEQPGVIYINPNVGGKP